MTLTSRRIAGVLMVGALLLSACQPAPQAGPTSPPAVATTAPAAKPATAPSPAVTTASPAASPAASAVAKPSAVASPSSIASPSAVASPAAGTSAQPVAAGAAAAAVSAPSPGCPNQPAAGGKQLRVGLVTDVGKVDDKSFNQSAWEGVQCAQQNLGLSDVKFIETTDPKDYGKNIEQFAQDNYDVIVTVGFGLSDDTISEAKKYPNIKFIGVDQFQSDTLPNLAGLVFDEDKAGYLAGYLAGSLTKSGIVGEVLGTPVVPPVEKYGLGYINGAKAAKSDVKVLSACHPGGLARGFSDPEWGNSTTQQEMSQNADIIFAAGGQTGNGGLLAIVDKGGSVLGIGVDTDQYLSLPEAKSILVSSAMKLITPGVFKIVKSVQDGTYQGGNILGEVGLAPYHDLASRVPDAVQQKMVQVTADVVAGRTKTGFTAPTGNCPQG